MIRATIVVKVSSQRAQRSLIRSIQPDNAKMKGLGVTARASPNRANFYVSYNGRIETFISTLEDLLRCIQAAEGTLQAISKK